MEFYSLAARQNHLLIAGTTGSGKSTAFHGIITYLMAKKNPAECRMWMIDPKRVELSRYKNNGFCDNYAATPDGAKSMLEYACQIMDKRYKYMEQNGLTDFNGNDIYIFIDELADLLILPDKKTAHFIRVYLSRIAQLGRAAHIHLFCATQFIRRSVLPEALIANMPSAVGLRTRDKLESRMIVGTAGCEDLPMYGFCLFRTPESRDPICMPVPKIG